MAAWAAYEALWQLEQFVKDCGSLSSLWRTVIAWSACEGLWQLDQLVKDCGSLSSLWRTVAAWAACEGLWQLVKDCGSLRSLWRTVAAWAACEGLWQIEQLVRHCSSLSSLWRTWLTTTQTSHTGLRIRPLQSYTNVLNIKAYNICNMLYTIKVSIPCLLPKKRKAYALLASILLQSIRLTKSRCQYIPATICHWKICVTSHHRINLI